MYLGNMVEIASHEEIYTKLYILIHKHSFLLYLNLIKKKNRVILKGELPSPSNPPSGCPFQTRCPLGVNKEGRTKERNIQTIALANV